MKVWADYNIMFDADELYQEEGSYDDVHERLNGARTFSSEDGENWERDQQALSGLNYLKENGQIEDVQLRDPQAQGMAESTDSKVIYEQNGEEHEVYFRAVK